MNRTQRHANHSSNHNKLGRIMNLSGKLRAGLAATIVLVLVVGFQFYVSSVNRRGGLALFHFQTLSDLIVAKAQLMLATATGSSPECHVVAGSSTTHAMQHAELDMRWEICAGSNPASQPDVRVLAERIRPELMQIIGFQQQVLQWYYPDLRLNLDLSVTNSSFYHKPSILLSFECNN